MNSCGLISGMDLFIRWEYGIQPENLPPAEDVKKVERRLAAADKKSLDKPDALDN